LGHYAGEYPMTKKAVIVDDEPFVREDLRQLLFNHPEIEIIGEAGSLEEAGRLLKQVQPDVVFLDVQLRGGSGFELVPEIPPTCPIIFFTAYDQYAVRAFEVNALDYLLKPVKADRLAASLLKLDATEIRREADGNPTTIYNTDDQIFIQTAEEQRFIPLKDISTVTAVGGNYTELVQRTGPPLTVRRTLKQWEKRLPSRLFFRIHRSVILNLDQIKHLRTEKNGSGTLYIFNVDQSFEVSRRILPRLKELISKNLN
jgi:two-component system LytT family response regulator